MIYKIQKRISPKIRGRYSYTHPYRLQWYKAQSHSVNRWPYKLEKTRKQQHQYTEMERKAVNALLALQNSQAGNLTTGETAHSGLK